MLQFEIFENIYIISSTDQINFFNTHIKLGVIRWTSCQAKVRWKKKRKQKREREDIMDKS